MLKLPTEVRSRFSASTVNTFNRAVEELKNLGVRFMVAPQTFLNKVNQRSKVYNSIDAKATSIAVRVHIKECVIQVIDNGNGISKTNLKFIGLDHTTCKYEEYLDTSAPMNYGFRGQALASLIKITKHVNIITRCKTSQETWIKSFIEGKEHMLSKTDVRPSKGTTVELKGFLYNLMIRKKTTVELNELNKIKTFLETLTLVHHELSLSLRDDSRNEIIYTAHKNRDIYQSLVLLCGLEQPYFKELQVEKGNYKVKAYITDKVHKFHWIYLNNRFISNSRLQKKINDIFSKHQNINKDMKIKTKKIHDELILQTKKIPSHFIFITCPYQEYDLSHTPKQTLLEFRNWDDITKLLDKAIQFYYGQLKVKEVDKKNIPKENNEVVDTRNEVKKIVYRLLGNKQKRNRISQMVNGRKGKFAKRNLKINNLPLNQIQPNVKKAERKNNIQNPNIKNNMISNKCKAKNIEGKQGQKIYMRKPELLKKSYRKIKKTKESPQKNAVIDKFKNNCTSVKKRCHQLAQTVQYLLPICHQQRNVIINKTIQMDNFIKNNKQYTVKKHVEEITIETTNFESSFFKHSHPKEILTSPNFDRQHVQKNDLYYVNKMTAMSAVSSQCKQVMTPKGLTFTSHLRLPIQSFKSHGYTHSYNGSSGSAPQYLCNKNNKQHFMATESLANFSLYKEKKEKPKKERFFSYLNNVPKAKEKFIPYNSSLLDGSSYAIETILTNDIKLKEDNVSVLDTYQLINCNAQDSQRNSKEINTFSDKLMKYCYSVPKNNQNASKLITKNVSKPCIKPIGAEFAYVLGSSKLSYNNFTENKTIDGIKSNYFEEFDQHCDSTNIPDKAVSSKCKKVMKSTYTLSIPQTSSDVNIVEPNDNNQQCDSLLKNNKTSNLNITQNSISNVVFISKSQPMNLKGTSKNLELDIFNTADDQAANEYIKDLGNITKSNRKISCQSNELSVDALICHLDNIAIASDNDNDLNTGLSFDNSGMKNNKNIEEPFKMKYRHSFLPKGMSPICLKKTILDSLSTKFFDTDFFANEIYDDFIDNVKITTTIYEPNVQIVDDYASNNLNKCKNTWKKNSDPLIFTCQSLTLADVLGQVDTKFVAARMEGKYYKTEVSSEFLVLFDQHAIHERIKLESNLSDYLIGDRWQSVEIDNIVLNFPSDELLYVCNYEAKFKQFGLQWTLLNNYELSVNAIPLAILSKNTRSVGKIMKAVENLIIELVESLRSQRGVTVYPKSIMDLVFSEACRYAIKFGDKLTYAHCVELIQKLSLCKVPFKCAHGRPVMAVLMDIEKTSDDKYRINLAELAEFKKSAQKK